MSRWDKVTPEERAKWQAETARTSTERLAEMRASGITTVEVIDSGTGEDCPACAALAARGPIPIADAPALPPKSCSCKPWCRVVMVAVEGDDAPPPASGPSVEESVAVMRQALRPTGSVDRKATPSTISAVVRSTPASGRGGSAVKATVIALLAAILLLIAVLVGVEMRRDQRAAEAARSAQRAIEAARAQAIRDAEAARLEEARHGARPIPPPLSEPKPIEQVIEEKTQPNVRPLRPGEA